MLELGALFLRFFHISIDHSIEYMRQIRHDCGMNAHWGIEFADVECEMWRKKLT